MAEEVQAVMENDVAETVSRVYEVGYHVIPTVVEENLEKIVGGIRSLIEKAGGSFIAEGAPTMTKLAYDMEAREGDKTVSHDRSSFGWIKFEAPVAAAQELEQMLKTNPAILRHIVFQTVREETRARIKLPTVREVKRTGVIKAAPRREEVPAAPVSEEDLDKAIQDITAE